MLRTSCARSAARLASRTRSRSGADICSTTARNPDPRTITHQSSTPASGCAVSVVSISGPATPAAAISALSRAGVSIRSQGKGRRSRTGRTCLTASQKAVDPGS